MIWYLIGYVAMAFISGPLVTFYCIRMAKRRGYDAGEILTYMLQFHTEREAKNVNDDTSWVIVISMCVFNTIFWPVKVLRMIFLDIPDSIEYYETQRIKEEA